MLSFYFMKLLISNIVFNEKITYNNNNNNILRSQIDDFILLFISIKLEKTGLVFGKVGNWDLKMKPQKAQTRFMSEWHDRQDL